MIDAREIRIGNYVGFDTGGKKYRKFYHCKVKELQQKQVIIIDPIDMDIALFYSGDSLQPIPLTEEILGNCRFAQTFSSDPQIRPASKKYELNGLILHQHNEDVDKFYFYCEDIVLEVSTLHQLMNLYYSLTGKEIEYNPK